MLALGLGVGLNMAPSGGPSVYATWNPADKSSDITLSGGDLTATHAAGGWVSLRSTIGKNSGSSVVEITAANTTCVGFGDVNFLLSSYTGNSSASAGFATHSLSYLQNGITGGATGDLTGGADTYMLVFNHDTGKVWLIQDNDEAGTGDAEAQTNPTWTWTPGMTLYVAGSLFNTGGTVVLNAGQSPFVNTPPSWATPYWGS